MQNTESKYLIVIKSDNLSEEQTAELKSKFEALLGEGVAVVGLTPNDSLEVHTIHPVVNTQSLA